MLDAGNPFFTDVAQGIEEAAQEAGLTLFLCNSNESADCEARYLELLEQQRVRGVLITPVDPAGGRLLELPARGTPVVVDRAATARTHCSVAVDDVLGATWPRRICSISAMSASRSSEDRRASDKSVIACRGVRTAAARAGRPNDNVIEIATSGLTVREGRSAGERIAGIPALRRPTAAFCANDLLALGLFQQCASLGLRVPEELAIVGYDEIEFAAAATVPLSSVRQARRLLGRTATKLLLEEYKNPEHEHQQILFTPELVVRASTHRPSRETGPFSVKRSPSPATSSNTLRVRLDPASAQDPATPSPRYVSSSPTPRPATPART